MGTRTAIRSTAQELASLRRDFQAAVGRADVDGVIATFDDDARLITPAGEQIDGRSAIASYWRAGFQAGTSGIELVPDGFEIGDRVAWESGQYGLTARPPYEEPATERGRYLTVYRQDPERRWRRAIDLLNPTAMKTTPRPSRGIRVTAGEVAGDGAVNEQTFNSLEPKGTPR